MSGARLALLPAVLLLAGCQSWWIAAPLQPGALTPDAPALRVGVVAPVLPRDQDLRMPGWQTLPLEMTAPLWAPAVPGLIVLGSGQKHLQHDPIARALQLVSLPDPALVARDRFVEEWNGAGRLPRADAVALPPLDRGDAAAALAAPGAGPILLLGTTDFDLHWTHAREDLTNDFAAIPAGPPDFRFVVYVSAALFDETGRKLLWCDSELVPAEWSMDGYTERPLGDSDVATLAQWTSGGGLRLASTAEEWGRKRGDEIANLLGSALDEQASAATPTP